MFEKIGAGVGKDGAEYHHVAYTTDGKLWFVSRKGVDQPKYSFFHRTILTGGYVVSFDLNAKKWSPRVDFNAIDMDENREEIVFGHGNNLYALVYQGYEGVRYRDLLKWSGDKWQKVAMKVDDASHFATDGRGQVAYGKNEKGLYLVATDESKGQVKVAELAIAADGASAEVGLVMELPQDKLPFISSMGWVCGIGVHKQNAILYGCSQGCGVRWEPKRLCFVDLQTKQASMSPNEDQSEPSPPWAFLGPSTTAVLADGRWVMMGGSRQIGMSDSEKDNSVWSLKIGSGSPQWQKETTELPADLEEEYSVGVGDGNNTVYYADRNAVYKASF